MPLRLRFYDGQTPKFVRRARKKIFENACSDFAPLENAMDRRSADRELKKPDQKDALVLFLHLSQYTDAASRMPKWAKNVREESVIVFYSGGGISSSECTDIETARSVAGMDGRVFIHRPSFDGLLGADDATVAGIQKLIRRLEGEYQQSGHSLKGTSFSPDEFGWPGIMEHVHFEYASRFLYSLFGMLKGEYYRAEEAKAHWRQLQSIKTGVLKTLQARRERAALDNIWNECDDIFKKYLQPDGQTIERLKCLRNILFGEDSEQGLVKNIDSIWGSG